MFLKGGDTGVPDVWIRSLVHVGRNNEDGVEQPCGVPTPYHREAGNTVIRRVMGDNGGQGSDIHGGDAFSGHIHRPLEGNGSTVGGPTTPTGSLRSGHRI